MTTHTVQAPLFGREVTLDHSERAIGYSILLLRIVMGWILFQGGIVKVIDPEWTAVGFLQTAIPEGNPFIATWQNMAASRLIDILVAWG